MLHSCAVIVHVAAILSEYIDLSAAHCFFYPVTYEMTVSVPVYAGDSGRQSPHYIFGARVYIHKDYSFNDFVLIEPYESNVAVLGLASPSIFKNATL